MAATGAAAWQPVIAAGVPDTAYVDTLAQVATIASCLVIFSPVMSIIQVMKMETTPSAREIKGHLLPYAMLFAQSFLWVFYGIATLNQPIVQINCLGSVISLIYLAILVRHAPDPDRFVLQPALGSAVGTLGFFCLVTMQWKSPMEREHCFAWCAIVFNVLLIAAPLCGIIEVLKTRSLEGYPVALTVAGFISCCLWGEYSIVTHSFLYFLPNLLGIILNSFQLTVISWVFFRYDEQSAANEKNENEDCYGEFGLTPQTENLAKGAKEGNLLKIFSSAMSILDFTGKNFQASSQPLLAPNPRSVGAQWPKNPNPLIVVNKRGSECLL